MARFLIFACLAAALASCGRGSTNAKLPNDALSDFNNAYQNYAAALGTTPTGIAELKSFEPSSKGVQAAEAGELIVVWKAKVADTPEAARTVLAYEKDVPQKGGRVLMVDGAIKDMTPQEFAASKTRP